MKRNYIYNLAICSVGTLLTILSSCKKESENIFTMFEGLKVEYKDTAAPDEVYVEFNLSKTATGAIMSKVILTETGSTTPVYTTSIPFAQRFGYNSGVLVLKAANPQTVSYTITVLDDAGNDISAQVTKTFPAGKLVVVNPKLATDKEDRTFAEGDTVYLDYKIMSANDNIKYVHLYSFTGATEPADETVATLPDDAADKRSYRGAVRVALNRDGGSRFRIYAKNEEDDFIGDGYTHVNTNVDAGFEYTANKYVFAPRFEATAAEPDLESACFYSISKKRTYNYTEAKANSADIDFCIYLTQNTGTNKAIVPYLLNLFSLSAATNPLAGKFDFTDWTKRTTRFTSSLALIAQLSGASDKAANVVFFDEMISGKAINTAIGAGRYSANLIRSSVTNIQWGNVTFFKTQEGKFGAMYYNMFTKNYEGKWYVNIDVKVAK